MRFVLLTNVVSPHMIPMAKVIADRIGTDNFCYLAVDGVSELRKKIGWADESLYPWVHVKNSDESYEEFLSRHEVDTADIVLLNIRDSALIRRRAALGKKTFFSFERWFRPPYRMWRLLHPRFLWMALCFARELKLGHVIGLGIGVWAVRDMARLCGLTSGDVRCLWHTPEVDFEAEPGGHVQLAELQDISTTKFGIGNMRMWAYFVDKGAETCVARNTSDKGRLSVLWVGRMLNCKRVETIIDAVSMVNRISPVLQLDIYGTGPAEVKLKERNCSDMIAFHPAVSGEKVRDLMQRHDIYVFASDANDGWGVVVNEALLEGMCVLGTYEAGASATLFPKESLFHSGDAVALAGILQELCDNRAELERRKKMSAQIVAKWLPSSGAEYLLEGFGK